MKPFRVSTSLYDADRFAWLERQAAALRARRWRDLDVEHLVEELEDLGKSERRELRSRLKVVLQHLLKLRYQPEKAAGSWHAAVRDQRFEIAQLLDDSPTLRHLVPQSIEKVYPAARHAAAAETALPLDVFPLICPFPVDEILLG